jgi:hypothetical protein
MERFEDKIKLDSNQRVEVERYLGISGMNEFTILKIIRKLKDLERRMQEMKYK